jgi:hypothetical protein
VKPADPPYGIGINVTGTVGGPRLDVLLEWKYYSSTLNSIVGFRIKRTSNTGAVTTEDLTPASDYCSPNPNTGEAACVYTITLLDPPDRTCGQTFQVAALYNGLGGIAVPSDYTYAAAIPSCPSTGQQ